MVDNMRVYTNRANIRLVSQADADLLLDYYVTNRVHLAQWEAARDREFYTLSNMENLLRQREQEHEQGSAYHFAAFAPDDSEILALCSYTNVLRGIFQACYLGYSVSKTYEGKGIMTELLKVTNEFVFDELKLHRVMANYIPSNKRSAALLEKLGFEKEGEAKSYLKIAGKWQDHILTAKINRCE